MPSKKPIGCRKPKCSLNVAFSGRKNLPPLFVTAKVRRAIERLLPTDHHRRLRKYFEVYGCLHCSRKNLIYGANGFCELCITMIGKRLRKLDQTLQAELLPAAPKAEEIYLESYNDARRLLADLRRKAGKAPERAKPFLRAQAKVYLDV